ncbi:hypothetical protein Psi02_28360 [Planotetraspora silvatica]|uniref:Lipoprotein n=1 Tax=Planotetraspora silvatica TaxID=234614 RepID=A0A8J3UK27_9ACTN|nr:hypothetical protein [Planotetraspora silvatica]GII46412.1 hypothetical protein Psi02_28360 [Planotetraspora silvatica]
MLIRALRTAKAVLLVATGLLPVACSACSWSEADIRRLHSQLASAVPESLGAMSVGAIQNGSECDEDGQGVWADVTVRHVRSYTDVIGELKRQGWSDLSAEERARFLDDSPVVKRKVGDRTVMAWVLSPITAPDAPNGYVELSFEFQDEDS